MEINDNLFTVKNFYLLIITVLVIVILLLRSCSPTPPPTKPIITTKIDTVWVKREDSIVYKPGKIKYIPGDTVFKDVDTTAILRDYFSKVVYTDTIKLDTFGIIVLRDTITKNRIQNRITKFDYKIPTITKETIIEHPYVPKFQGYVGGEIMVGTPTGITYFGPVFTAKTKKDKMYSIGVGINPSEGIQYKFSTSWKIRLKKQVP